MKTLNMAALVIALSVITAFAQTGGGGGSSSNSTNSVSGTWKVTGDVMGNPVNSVCTFAQDDKKLTGSCKLAQADKPVEIKGEVNEKKVVFQHNTDYEGQTLTIVYTGTLDAAGSQLKGDIDVQPMSVAGTFTAQKQEAKKEEPKKAQG